MCPNIPPKPIKPNLPPRRPAPRDLKHTSRNSKCRISSHNFSTRYPFCGVATLSFGDGACFAVLGVYVCDGEAGTIGERLGCSEVSEEVPVAFEDIELFGGGLLVVTSEWPCSG